MGRETAVMGRHGPWRELSLKSVLHREHHGAVGWGYQIGGRPCVEPTVVAGLALLSATGPGELGDLMPAAREAAQWLARQQQEDGSVGISLELGHPGWGTSYAVWLWRNVEGFESQIERAADWIEGQRSRTTPRIPESPIGHDTSIEGWSWVEGTHAWLEPTAAAIVALHLAGRGDSPRVAEGLRMIRDRQIATGGWNYGNSEVFSKSLRPLPGPTGMALVALASHRSRHADIANALDFLEDTLATLRSPRSLSWGIVGLRAWGRKPAAIEHWLAEAYEAGQPAGHSPIHEAFLILASADRTLELLNLE